VINIIILLLILELLATWMLSSYNYFSKKQKWYWAYVYDRQIENDIGSDTLVLGCSVSNQLFPFMAKKNYKTTSAVDLAATSYFFTSKAIQSNPNLKTVIILTIPQSMSYIFENSYTYNIFIKPFFNYRNIKYFDSYLLKKILRRPLGFLGFFNFYKVLPIDDISYQFDQIQGDCKMSEFYAHYLAKLWDLTNNKGIKLIFTPCPVSEISMKQYHYFDPLKANISERGFSPLFTDYFNKINTLPDTCFIKDRIHFTEKYLKNHRSEILTKIKI